MDILREVGAFIHKGTIPESLQLAATLRFLAVGGFQRVVANDLKISVDRTTMCKILWRVMKVLEDKVCASCAQLQPWCFYLAYECSYKRGNGMQNSWLLGDSGQHRYNKVHTSARNIIKRSIWNLKSRFFIDSIFILIIWWLSCQIDLKNVTRCFW